MPDTCPAPAAGGSQLAERTGVAASAIRYYERVGVLPVAARTSGQRRYAEDTLRRLEVIGVTKDAGFTLEETRLILEASDSGNDPSGALRTLAGRKLPEIETLIIRAEAMRDWLKLAQGCGCPTLDVCALFEETQSRALTPS